MNVAEISFWLINFKMSVEESICLTMVSRSQNFATYHGEPDKGVHDCWVSDTCMNLSEIARLGTLFTDNSFC